MTSIMTFQLGNGNQRIIIGDTQHTYYSSTCENSKIFPLKDNLLIFCGSGNDRIIDGINTRIVSIDDLDFCSDKIIKFKEDDFEGKFALQDLDGEVRLKEIHGTQFMIFDSKTLDGKKITNNIPKSVGNIEIIGSGGEFVGLITDSLDSLYELDFNDENKETILISILESFCMLGRQDSATGHPAIFKLEGYLMEKDKIPRKIEIKFKHNIKILENYEYEVEE